MNVQVSPMPGGDAFLVRPPTAGDVHQLVQGGAGRAVGDVHGARRDGKQGSVQSTALSRNRW
jgi:hypothetical protein